MIEETISGFDVSSYFIYRIAEFLVMLSHDTLHSKQVIKVQDLIKHCDLLLASGHEPETHGKYFEKDQRRKSRSDGIRFFPLGKNTKTILKKIIFFFS